jgi:hypothetical protein
MELGDENCSVIVINDTIVNGIKINIMFAI